jgi:hypothetical protein
LKRRQDPTKDDNAGNARLAKLLHTVSPSH